jgi:hypothetical protein
MEASVTQYPSSRICALSATVIALGRIVNSDPPSERRPDFGTVLPEWKKLNARRGTKKTTKNQKESKTRAE